MSTLVRDWSLHGKGPEAKISLSPRGDTDGPSFPLDIGLTNEIPGTLHPSRRCTGGMFGDVSEGLWERPDGTNLRVAIKYLRAVDVRSSTTEEDVDLRLQKRMNRERHIWGRLRHPYILPLLGFQRGKPPCLVSPWCAKGNLVEFLAKNPQFTRLDKLRLILQAALGLEYLHTLDPPVCHGDVKPTNVMINDQLDAVLCDFGLAKAMRSIEAHTGFTTSGVAGGTKHYQSPELLFNDERTIPGDVYAFGGLILAVMSGRAPFAEKKGDVWVMIIAKGAMPEPASHPAIPASDPLWALMRRCWAFEQVDRPTMTEVAEFLKEEILRLENEIS